MIARGTTRKSPLYGDWPIRAKFLVGLGLLLLLIAILSVLGVAGQPGSLRSVLSPLKFETYLDDEPEQPIETLLAKASVEKGQATAKQCAACHTFEKGGPNRVGPNLWNIVGSDRGEGRGGFNFSAAMKGKGGKWTFDELNKFLANPRQYIPGTAMTYAGISKAEQRADVIDYLHTLSDNPVPLPKAAENAPAGGEQKK